MDLKDLVKKIHSLRDLRSAINEVKSLQKDAKVIPIKPQESAPALTREQQRSEVKGAMQSTQSPLQHLGFNLTRSGEGKVIHNIGMKGSDWHYEMHHNSHDSMKGKPPYTVLLADSNGNVKSQSPKVFGSHVDAAKEIANHSDSGKWSDK